MNRRSVPRRSLAGPALLLALGLLLAFAVPALADYLGPDRHVVDMVEVRDPSNDYWTCGNSNPPPGILGTCILQNPSNPCPDAGGYHPSKEQQRAWCQWGSNYSDYTGCGCTPAYSCETVEYDLPPATISGALSGCTIQNGWCVTSPSLGLQGAEPLAGYDIIALEGSRNSDPFTCPGALCAVPLLEGANAFSFWALSSYGDSSFMGSLDAQVDTVPPATSFISPPEGSAVWAAGVVSFSGLSSDATSGMASAQISLDGGAAWLPLALSPDGSWGYTWDTRPEGDAAHAVRARAWDQAGNLGNEAQVVVALDNTAPSVDLPDRWMIWEPIALRATDVGAGIQRLELTIQGGELGVRKYFFAAGQVSWAWDRRIEGVLAPVGEYGVTLEAWDALGNQGSDHGVLVIPDPGASAPALPEPEAAVEEGSAEGPPPTGPSPVVTFPPFVGPTPTASSAEALAGVGPEGPQGSTDEAASEGGGSGVLWGAAALAAIGSATAYVLTKKREREEEHEAELAQKKAQAAEWAAQAASLHKQVDANRNAAKAAVAAAAAAAVEAARRRRDEFSEWQQQRREAREIAAQQRELEARRRREQAEEAARRAEAVRLAAAAALAERLRVIAQARDEMPPPAVEVPWWQRAWNTVTETVDSAITWVDEHQALLAVGLGVAMGAVAIVLTAGVATPLVVAAAAVAGATFTAAAGAAATTVGLNAYFHRPLGTNLVRNVALAGGAAFVTSGAGMAVRTGLATRAAWAIGNSVTALCYRFPTTCARAEVAMSAMDTVEQVGLQAQLTVQTALHDPGAAETALELQLEMMDGGTPGNTAIREVRELGDEAFEVLARHGDEAADLATTVARHRDDVVEVLDRGMVRVHPESAAEFADDLRASLNTPELIAARGGVEVQVWHSTSTGSVYASVPTREALEALDRLQTIVDSGRRTGDDVEELLETIARASSRGSGDRVVLGRFGGTGAYIQEALDTNGVFYDTSDEVYQRLRGMGFDPIDVNEAFLRQREDAGLAFEFSLRGFTDQEAQREVQAILALAEGDLAGARASLRLETWEEFPARIQEASWLLGTGYDPVVDLQEMIIRWQR